MIIKVERKKNVYENYWFSHYKDKINCTNRIQSISFIADKVFTQKEQVEFINFVKKELQKLFNKQYKCYLLCRRILINKNSKVENHKKLWKYIEQKYNIEHCNLGEEIKIDGKYYCGILEMNLEDINTAVEIAAKEGSNAGIFISKKKDNLSKEKLERLAPLAYNYTKNVIGINIGDVSFYLSEIGDIVIRLADDSVGLEFDLIYDSSCLTL